MSHDNDQEFIDAISFAQAGTNRCKVIKSLKKDIRIPTQIAEDLGLRTCQISATLSELKEAKIVVCLNEEKKRGRLYKLTDLGVRVYEFLGD